MPFSVILVCHFFRCFPFSPFSVFHYSHFLGVFIFLFSPVFSIFTFLKCFHFSTFSCVSFLTFFWWFCVALPRVPLIWEIFFLTLISPYTLFGVLPIWVSVFFLRCFLHYTLSQYLTQLAFIEVSLKVVISSLNSVGTSTEVGNMDSVYLFVWIVQCLAKGISRMFYFCVRCRYRLFY